MGVRYKRSNLDADIRNLSRASKEFKGMIHNEMESIAPAIEDAMVFYSRAAGKKRQSGKMEDAMRAEVSGTGLQLRFGFVRRLLNYFQYQTVTGFTHWNSGKFIEPSLALNDAKADAELLMREAAVRVRRNFMARLRRR